MAQLLQLRQQLPLEGPAHDGLRPAKELTQAGIVHAVLGGGQGPQRHKVLGEVDAALEEHHKQIVELAVPVGQIGVAPAVIDHLVHVDDHGPQGISQRGHVPAAGQGLHLHAQVVHPLAHGAEVATPPDDAGIEPQSRRHHHQPTAQGQQLDGQLLGLDGHQLEKDKLHAVYKVGLGGEFGAHEVHQHKGHHQVQPHRPPQAPPRSEGGQGHQEHGGGSFGQLPGSEVLLVPGAKQQGEEGGHGGIPHPEHPPHPQQQDERHENDGQGGQPPGTHHRQAFGAKFLPPLRSFSLHGLSLLSLFMIHPTSPCHKTGNAPAHMRRGRCISFSGCAWGRGCGRHGPQTPPPSRYGRASPGRSPAGRQTPRCPPPSCRGRG